MSWASWSDLHHSLNDLYMATFMSLITVLIRLLHDLDSLLRLISFMPLMAILIWLPSCPWWPSWSDYLHALDGLLIWFTSCPWWPLYDYFHLWKPSWSNCFMTFYSLPRLISFMPLKAILISLPLCFDGHLDLLTFMPLIAFLIWLPSCSWWPSWSDYHHVLDNHLDQIASWPW